MLNLDYPDPKIPGPKPPAGSLDSRLRGNDDLNAERPNRAYRAYVWLLDPERPCTAVCFLYFLLALCVSGALGDWRWFAWGVALPILAACAVFLAIAVTLVFTRFILRLLM